MSSSWVIRLTDQWSMNWSMVMSHALGPAQLWPLKTEMFILHFSKIFRIHWYRNVTEIYDKRRFHMLSTVVLLLSLLLLLWGRWGWLCVCPPGWQSFGLVGTMQCQVAAGHSEQNHLGQGKHCLIYHVIYKLQLNMRIQYKYLLI